MAFTSIEEAYEVVKRKMNLTANIEDVLVYFYPNDQFTFQAVLDTGKIITVYKTVLTNNEKESLFDFLVLNDMYENTEHDFYNTPLCNKTECMNPQSTRFTTWVKEICQEVLKLYSLYTSNMVKYIQYMYNDIEDFSLTMKGQLVNILLKFEGANPLHYVVEIKFFMNRSFEEAKYLCLEDCKKILERKYNSTD